MKKTQLLLISILINTLVFGQDLTSTIKGTVLDQQSEYPLIGAVIVLVGSDPMIATSADIDGSFRLENVPIGRQSVEIKYVGYKPTTLANLEVRSGKELNINVKLEESIDELSVIEVHATKKGESLNEMATVSSREISMEDVGRFSGSLQDPARMAQNYAGVSGASDDRNDIIIRGNSPLGVLWRMEGVDIPSPNHFSTLGSTGGPVSMLNINNLANSDFMTSAWSADYGNATSGVFDLKLRKGNKDKREYLGQVGFNGFELGAEGPFKEGGKGSYMANYRYSTLGVLDLIGLDLGTGAAVPNYQDLTFKINLPNEKLGTFSIWGIGGFSDIEFKATEEVDTTNLFVRNDQESVFGSKTFIGGASHLYFFDDKTFSKMSVSVNSAQTVGLFEEVDFKNDTRSLLADFNRKQTKVTAHYKVNRKFNARNSASIGIIADNYFLSMFDSSLVRRGDSLIPDNIYKKTSDINESLTLLQSYVNWQHRFNENLTLNMGLHSQHFLLTETNSFEPRLGLKYKVKENQTINIGAGMHSQTQPMTLYFVENTDVDGNKIFPNQELGFTKAFHSVAGYDLFIGRDFRLKTEIYYQYLYQIPIDADTATPFSMLNEGAGFILPNATGLSNDGEGFNYGAELTLEKFYNKGYYILFTTSLFESKYAGSDNVERNTRFNGNYVVNMLGGKEFKIKDNQILAFDAKTTFAGGKRYTPIDLEQSGLTGREVRKGEEAFTKQYAPYFRADLKISYTLNSNKFTQKWALDIQNITSEKNIFITQYDSTLNKEVTQYQRGFFPMMTYQIYF